MILHCVSPVQFLEPFSSPSPLPHFFSLLQPPFHKIYWQSKTFLNLQAVPTGAVFCSNSVLIKSPCFSVPFFSSFDVPPIAPTTKCYLNAFNDPYSCDFLL